MHLPEVSANDQHANGMSSEEQDSEDFDKHDDNTGGSARTDGDAYHRLRAQKQKNSSERTCDVSLQKTSQNHNEPIQEFLLHQVRKRSDFITQPKVFYIGLFAVKYKFHFCLNIFQTGIHSSDQLNKKLTTCVAGPYEGSTADLGDLE